MPKNCVQLGHAEHRREPIMNNEEKILELLEGLTRTVAQQGTQLAQQGELLKELDDRSKRTAVLLESDIAPKIQLLFDGHDELRRKMDTLATKEQVEELAGDVDIIRSVVSRHSSDISELKKAL